MRNVGIPAGWVYSNGNVNIFKWLKLKMFYFQQLRAAWADQARTPTHNAAPKEAAASGAMKSERQRVKTGEECGGSRILQLQWQLKWFSFSIADAIKIVFDTLPGRQTQTEPALPSPGPEQSENTDTSVNEVATSWACRPLLSFGQVLSATVYGSASRHRTQSRDLSIAKSFHAPDEC